MRNPTPEKSSTKIIPRPLLEFAKIVPAFCKKQILDFARDSHRDPDELKKPFWFRYGLEIGIGTAILVFLISTFAPSVAYQTSRWRTYRPTIELGSDRWHVSFDETTGCKDHLEKSCIGNPSNEALWKSNKTFDIFGHGAEVKQMLGKTFWIGLELTAQEIATAKEENSNVLGIGLFNSSYRIFVNGELTDSGTGFDFTPSTIRLPSALLASKAPIRVSVEISHNLGSRIPLWQTKGMLGLFKDDTSRSMLGYWTSFLSFTPLALASWSLFTAVLFFLLWISVPKKAEYFFFALYLSAFGALQVKNFGPIVYGADRGLLYIGDFWIVAFEGVAGCLIGASYARVKRVYFLWVVGIGSLVSISAYLSASDPIELYFYKDALMKFYIPAMFFIGAAFCFAQSVFLASEWPKQMNANSRNLRRNRLLLFALLLSVFGIVFYSQNSLILSITPQYIDRQIQLALMMLIGGVLFREYRDREKQFEIVQRSPYHDPFGGAASEVFGFLVSLDLINSSKLSNYSAETKADKRPTTIWNQMIGQVFAKNYSFKVADEGDGLKVFFEGPNSVLNLSQVVNAISESIDATAELQERMKGSNLIPEDASIHFRVGVIWGGIKPIWKEFVGVRTAEWEDAQGMTSFKDVTRIMDFEKLLNSGMPTRSSALIASDLLIEEHFPNFVWSRIEADVKDIGPVRILVFGKATEAHSNAA